VAFGKLVRIHGVAGVGVAVHEVEVAVEVEGGAIELGMVA